MAKPTRKQALETAVNQDDVVLMGLGVATSWLPPLGMALLAKGAVNILNKYKDARNLVSKEQELDRELLQVDFFNCSKKEYEEQVGYAIDIIDTDQRDKGILFVDNIHNKEIPRICNVGIDFKQYLVNENVEALIDCSFIPGRGPFGDAMRHGVPVARKYAESEK